MRSVFLVDYVRRFGLVLTLCSHASILLPDGIEIDSQTFTGNLGDCIGTRVSGCRVSMLKLTRILEFTALAPAIDQEINCE